MHWNRKLSRTEVSCDSIETHLGLAVESVLSTHKSARAALSISMWDFSYVIVLNIVECH